MQNIKISFGQFQQFTCHKQSAALQLTRKPVPVVKRKRQYAKCNILQQSYESPSKGLFLYRHQTDEDVSKHFTGQRPGTLLFLVWSWWMVMVVSGVNVLIFMARRGRGEAGEAVTGCGVVTMVQCEGTFPAGGRLPLVGGPELGGDQRWWRGRGTPPLPPHSATLQLHVLAKPCVNCSNDCIAEDRKRHV